MRNERGHLRGCPFFMVIFHVFPWLGVVAALVLFAIGAYFR